MSSIKIVTDGDVKVTFFEMATDTGKMLMAESQKNNQVMIMPIRKIILMMKIMIMLIILMMKIMIMLTMLMMMKIMNIL